MRNASATSRRQTKRLNTLEIALVFDVAHRHPASAPPRSAGRFKHLQRCRVLSRRRMLRVNDRNAMSGKRPNWPGGITIGGESWCWITCWKGAL